MPDILVAIVAIILAGLPPLTPQQVTRLETAADGRDHREEAFLALVESFDGWDGALGDTAIRLEPDLDAMLEDPPRYRGDLCRLRGVIQQRTELAAPYAVATEWFIRDDEGRPIVVYVIPYAVEPPRVWRDGNRVGIAARFYKAVEFTARDGVTRRYPAFVGAAPRPIPPSPAGGLTRLWLVGIPVVLGLAAFLVLLVIARRTPRDRPSVARIVTDEPSDDPRPLPEDPAEALAELKKRAVSDQRSARS